MKRLQMGQGLIEYVSIFAFLVQIILALFGPAVATELCEFFADNNIILDVCAPFLP